MSAFDTEDKEQARTAFLFGPNDIVLPSLFACFVAIVHLFDKFGWKVGMNQIDRKKGKENILKRRDFPRRNWNRKCVDCLEAFSLKSFFDCTYLVLKIKIIDNTLKAIKSIKHKSPSHTLLKSGSTTWIDINHIMRFTNIGSGANKQHSEKWREIAKAKKRLVAVGFMIDNENWRWCAEWAEWQEKNRIQSTDKHLIWLLSSDLNVRSLHQVYKPISI